MTWRLITRNLVTGLYHKIGLRFERVRFRAGIASWMLMAIIPGSAQTVAPTPSPTPGGTTSSVIQSADVPPRLSLYFQTMGSRMATAATAAVTINGTTTDSSGSRPAQIIVQYPGYLSYSDQAKTITFDGTQFQTKAGAVTSADEPIMESLMAHFPDSIFLQVIAGGALRRIGGHFRPSASTLKTYAGPTWTLFAFTPNQRPGLTAGGALQQNLFIAFDEQTGLMDEVRIVTATSTAQKTVIETQFSNWTQQNGQWFPGKIIRLQNGSQTLSFTVTSSGVGQALAPTAFQP